MSIVLVHVGRPSLCLGDVLAETSSLPLLLCCLRLLIDQLLVGSFLSLLLDAGGRAATRFGRLLATFEWLTSGGLWAVVVVRSYG